MFSAITTGWFNIVGIDAGSYVLKETTVPKGYNKCKDINVVISAIHGEDDADSASSLITKTQNGEKTKEIIVANKKGSLLPETGGIGTTVFYVVGAVLVVGAVVFLITRRRLKSADK